MTQQDLAALVQDGREGTGLQHDEHTTGCANAGPARLAVGGTRDSHAGGLAASACGWLGKTSSSRWLPRHCGGKARRCRLRTQRGSLFSSPRRAGSWRTLASMAESAPPDVGQPSGADATAPEWSPALGAAGWQPWTVGIAVLGAFALALAGRAIVSTATGDGVDALVGVALIVLNAAPIALALVLAHLHRRPTAGDFALCRPPLVRATGLLVAVWLGLTALTVLWGAALGLDGEEGQALTERPGTEGTLSVIVLVLVVTVVGPVGEEVLFRGYIFRALRNWRGVWPAAITTRAVRRDAPGVGVARADRPDRRLRHRDVPAVSLDRADCIHVSRCTRSATRFRSPARWTGPGRPRC